MASGERRGWLIAFTMFLCVVLNTGVYTAVGTFIPPLLKDFGGSHARMSWTFAIEGLSSAAFAPFTGMLLDHYDARWVVGGGMTIGGLAFLLASQAHSFPVLLLAYVILGIPLAASSVVPATLVVSNWLPKYRAFALGLTLCGGPLGASITSAVVTYIVQRAGWRWAYAALGLPALIIVTPLALTVIRTSPRGARSEQSGARRDDTSVPGLELGEALRARSFWLIAWMMFSWYFLGASVFHFVPYLVSAGFSAGQAAAAFSTLMALSTLGKIALGGCADRYGVRIVLALNLALLAIGQALLVHTPTTRSVEIYILFGLVTGSPYLLLQVIQVDSFGRKRFGTLSGLIALAGVMGGTLGGLAAGRIFDLSGSYGLAFLLFSVVCFVASPLPFACVPFAERHEMEPRLAEAGAG